MHERSTANCPQTLWCRINHEIKQVSFLCQGNPISGSCPQQYWYLATTSKTAAIKVMNPPKNTKQVTTFLWFEYYHHDAKFAWTSSHLRAFNTLKSALLETPILHYPDPTKHYIVYTYTRDDTCRAPLSQEHDGKELPFAFLSHTFTDSQ